MGARVDFMEPQAAQQAKPVVAGVPRVRVPAAAIRNDSGRTVVWLIRDQRLESRVVDAGPTSAGFREVRSGLSGGELLLLSGVDAPRQGLHVKLSNPK
jgi:hypothetical protein